MSEPGFGSVGDSTGLQAHILSSTIDSNANGGAGLPASYDADRRTVVEQMRRFAGSGDNGVYALCAYHLGWADADGRPLQQDAGKMLRPVLCLAVCRGYGDPGNQVRTGQLSPQGSPPLRFASGTAAVRGDPARAVCVAAALELLHAFSLVHDDIEDDDSTRHGRPTLWTVAGLPLALNAGDSLFALAHQALIETAAGLPPERGFLALRLFSDACLRMIEGQHLDIEFERRREVTTNEYIEMSRGKTGALLGASLALGGLFGGAPLDDVERLRQAGVELGLAFQAVDDVLAVWGDPALTGKAVGNDLARGKKSLPATLAMERGWMLCGESLAELRVRFEALGVREAVHAFALDRALAARRLLDESEMSEAARRELAGMIDFILSRKH